MTQEKQNGKQQDLKEMLNLCNRAISKAIENPNMASIIEFNGIESSLVEKLSCYMHDKQTDNTSLFKFTLCELKGNEMYEAHIRYKK